MTRKFLLGIILALMLSFSLKAADTVFVGKGAKLDTFSKGNLFPITISGMTPKIINSSYGLEYINVNIKAGLDNDLYIYLVDPNGSYYPLSLAGGGNYRNFDSTFFTDTASPAVFFGKGPFKGYYRPETLMRQINNGQAINGTWYLLVYDYNLARKDVVVNWSMKFSNHPDADYPLDSSNLPILAINTHGVTVPWYDPMAPCDLHFIDNVSGKYNYLKDSLNFNGHCGITLHGNYSRYFPKLSYSIEMRDSNQNVIDTSVLGMPKGHDFALVANYIDRTLLRNAIAQHIFGSMGNYTPRFRHVEVVLNGIYQGVFLFIEKIKIAKTRVNIAKLDTSSYSGDSLTGGYMLKQDWHGNSGWNSKYYMPVDTTWFPYFRFESPAIPSAPQQAYIQSYFDSFETAIYGTSKKSGLGNWRDFGDEKCMGDFFLTQELTRNLDGFRASFYMYKDRNSRDRHIHLGPVWDFDFSLYNYAWNDANDQSPTAWQYQSGWDAGFWWAKLFGTEGYGRGDGAWKNNLKCNWTVYRRHDLSQTSMDHWIDSNVALINTAQKRNFIEWGEFGNNQGVLGGAWFYAKTYIQEVDTLKGWIHRRLKWMDKYLPGTCNRDIDPPTVALNGFDTVFLEVNTSYRDSGITYRDNYGDTNVTVIKGSNLDTSTLGTYVISYFLSDKAGNKTNIQRVVIVIDTIPPTITFINGDTVKAEVLVKYKDINVVIADNYDLNPIVNKWGSFNFANDIPDSLGYFTMWYKATDQSGNMDSAMKVIHVVDTKAPSIWFGGRDTVRLEVYDTYSDTDVYLKDNFDKNPVLSSHGNLKNYKTDSLGIFKICYIAKDFSGNRDSIVRTLIVFDSIPPVLKLNGTDSVFVFQDSSYNDAGYIVSDNYDKHPGIDTSGNFKDTRNTGVYSITYQATDQSLNNSLKVSRIVTVSMAKDTSSGIDNSNLSAQNIQVYPNPGSGQFQVSIKLNSNSKAYINVYDEMGRELEGLRRDVTNGWSGILHLENEPAGIYTLKLQTETSAATRRLILIK